MSLHKRLIGQLVQILFGDGFDAGLTTPLFVMLKLDVIVFGIKNDKLIYRSTSNRSIKAAYKMESVRLVQVKDRPFFSAVGQKVWLLCKAS